MKQNLVFPSGVYGTDSDPLRQVEEVVGLMHEALKARGLGLGAMLQHTLFIKAGVVPPLEALSRFHPATYALAPELQTHKSVGTIIRVPEFPDPATAVMLDVVAGEPLSTEPGEDGYQRVPFTFGPPELAETIRDDYHLFTAGTEGLDFETGRLAPDLDGQIATVVDKLLHAATAAGLTLKHMIQHNLYVTLGNDPWEVIEKFHAELRRREPGLVDYLTAGSLMVVNGMAIDEFRLEMDAVFTTREADSPERIPLGWVDVAESVANGDLIFLDATPGADFTNNMELAEGLEAQLELAVQNVVRALARQGSSLDKMLKYRLTLKKGAGDITQVRDHFLELAHAAAPALKEAPAAETLLIAEGMLGEQLVAITPIVGRA